ncbi:hypothetical protein L596_028951 [Steinernema carpocapsae]|uniref:Uncharacterized protein n=1 Tax=Steinernema carpocapsae TaxID=34508 RepID=A0A4U5LT67_STECR|nr:hypothetical protein L596_028951 [Steinernema carpocapsae]
MSFKIPACRSRILAYFRVKNSRHKPLCIHRLGLEKWDKLLKSKNWWGGGHRRRKTGKGGQVTPKQGGNGGGPQPKPEESKNWAEAETRRAKKVRFVCL